MGYQPEVQAHGGPLPTTSRLVGTLPVISLHKLQDLHSRPS